MARTPGAAAATQASRRVLSSFAQAVALKDWPLAWTAAPVLARDSVVPPEFAWQQLHLTSPPPLPVVLAHLKVGAAAKGSWIPCELPHHLQHSSDRMLHARAGFVVAFGVFRM